jgi:catechol 2,3-dioxygenase-like lactoylglutathione lyase family enzyme
MIQTQSSLDCRLARFTNRFLEYASIGEAPMVRLDHLSLPVRDWQKSRDWYRRHLGFQVEFELADRKTAAMRDDADLTIFLQEGEVVSSPGLSFTIQIDDVEAKHRELVAAGLAFVHPPMKVFWGYGAELRDPDGYRLLLWDEKSMNEKDGE